MISLAPCKADSSLTIASFKYCVAKKSTSSFFCAIIILAKGSSPFSRATSALVLFFFLYGKYKSSNSCRSKLCWIFLSNSGVKAFCSSMDFTMASFRFRMASYSFWSLAICSICVSSRLPVLSFR